MSRREYTPLSAQMWEEKNRGQADWIRRLVTNATDDLVTRDELIRVSSRAHQAFAQQTHPLIRIGTHSRSSEPITSSTELRTCHIITSLHSLAVSITAIITLGALAMRALNTRKEKL